MRVLLLSHGFPPENLGGVEVHVQSLARELARNGHDVHVYARAGGGGTAQGSRTTTTIDGHRLTRAAYRWEGLEAFDDLYRCPPMADALRAFLDECDARGERFDLAHVHHLTGVSTDAIAILRERAIPVALSLHDYWLPCPRGQLFHRDGTFCGTVDVDRCAPCLQATWPGLVPPGSERDVAARTHRRARDLLGSADLLIAPSVRALPPFAALGADVSRVAIVEYGIDTAALRAVPAPAFGPGPLRIGCFGTVIPSKGVHVLLDAVRGLEPGSTAVRIHGNVVSYHGDAGYATNLFARLAPNAGVEFHGPYSPARLPALLADVDVVAAPALWAETWGIAVREGMAAGRPAFASRIGGLQDLPAEAAFVLEPGDVAAWRDALAGAVRDRGRLRAMSTAARREGRSFAAMTAQVTGLYGDLIAGRLGAGAAWPPGNQQPA
jgi:glycosyltransferase involved in cell wall biosynthesis